MLSPRRVAFSSVATASPGDRTIAQTLDKGKARESFDAALTIEDPAPHSRDPPTKNVDSPMTAASPLRRMRSMPTFNPSSEPPPYPSFPPHHMRRPSVTPREEEGKENLPPYSNDIHLTAIMPRKMEFTAPGVQAKDRKWRRVLCVLHGTVFKVYRCPRSVAGVGILENWWEKRVGVGDASAPPNTAPPAGVRASVDNSRSAKLDLTSNPNSAWGSRCLESATAHPTPGHWNSATPTTELLQPTSCSDLYGQRSATPSTSAWNCDLYSTSPSRTRRSSDQLPTSPSQLTISSSSRTIDAAETQSSNSSLIRSYTMQYAESGLGNDYAKRKNVIRLRLEGEQFLLQAVNVSSVVEWIEVRV
jgi:hypothetical protein